MAAVGRQTAAKARAMENELTRPLGVGVDVQPVSPADSDGVRSRVDSRTCGAPSQSSEPNSANLDWIALEPLTGNEKGDDPETTGTPRGGDPGADTLRPPADNSIAAIARPDALTLAADAGDSEAVVLAAMGDIFNTVTDGGDEPSGGSSGLRKRVADFFHEQHDSNNESTLARQQHPKKMRHG